jgi:hypothetical protein
MQPGTWAVHADAEKTLRALGERGDIIRTMQRAMRGEPRELAVFEPGDDGRTIIGRVAAKGLADELRDRGYLVIDGVDGKAHYVALNARDELANYPTGAVVEVKGSADVRAADKNIAALASDGLYRTDHHLAIAQGQAVPGRDPQEVVAAHVRRLEALRRAGIVERVAEGLWKVPDDLAERGRQYDAQRLGGVAVELKSHLPIERQARVIGATWLDQQLIGGGSGLGDLGFGGEAKQAMQQRADFLAEQGLAERRGQRVILARNLLGTLRNRELAQAAKDIAAETGLEHRPVADGQRVAGIYRRSVMLASGRYAMLDDGMGFSLVPWKPVIEQRLGQQLAATVRGGGVSWEIGGVSQFGQFVQLGLDLIETMPDGVQQALARRCRRNAARGAGEQPDLKSGFQAIDCLTQSRLRHPQMRCGTREAAFARDGHEVQKVVEVTSGHGAQSPTYLKNN